MSDRLVIIGAGGHGKVIADIAVKCGYADICFLDDKNIGACLGFPIIGRCSEAQKWVDGNTVFVVALGNNKNRKEYVQTHNLPYVTLIHPSAQIGLDVKIGAGTVVLANAVINTCAHIGNHCIINSGAIVEHDNVIGDYVHISPNAALGGTVWIGAGTHICIGATVINNRTICANTVVGAGSVIIEDIREHGTYVGVPGRKIK